MSNFKIKNLPQIKLTDLLKKKRTNLKQFISSFGIAAYQTLVQKCEKMGVSPPSEEEFKKIVEVPVSSPQEGLIVLDPPDLLKDSTGEKIPVDSTSYPSEESSSDKKIVKKNEKNLKIDESVFVTKLQTDSFEKSYPDFCDATSVDDDIDSSAAKLYNLKKQNS